MHRHCDQLPAAPLQEDFDIEVVALAVEKDLAANHDREKLAGLMIEGVPFGDWLRSDLRELRRLRRAAVTRSRRKADAMAAAMARAKRKHGMPLTEEEIALADAAEEKAAREFSKRLNRKTKNVVRRVNPRSS